MIKIICVGKLKENYLKDMVEDYLTRINKYHKVVIEEVKDSNMQNEKIEILKHIKKDDYIISLVINSNQITSTELSSKINNLFINGRSSIVFIIGGSDGLDDEIINMSDERLSFSKLTFPHGLFRAMLLEQIYRSFKIMNNETYHK